MGDLFDDFMRELERRRAEAEGRAPKDDSGDPQEPDDPDQPDPDDEGDKANDNGTPDEPAAADDDETGAADRDDEPKPAAPAGAGRPTSLASRRRRRSAGTPPPKTGPRPVGGPDDGAGPPSVGHIVRRAGIGIALIAILVILVLFAAGINLWTDAIWYKSVGYDSVFWTRLGVQAGLFVGAGLLALIVLLGNLLLADRLTPPVDPERPGRLKTVAGRLVDAQRQAERSARSRATGGSLGPFGAAGARSGGGELSFSFDAEDMPDVVPLGTWAIAGVAVLLALGVAGAVTGAWETLLLWIHRVPFSPTQTVVDPIFGRDIGFFLFELPFYRLVQSLVNGLLLASLVVAGARYLLATTRGGEVFVTRVRVHLAVLGGLYLFSVAFGYQLDKYELVYSQAGVATGVAFADANARFLAYDVLTFLSGLAGALLIAGAFTRWMWPLAVILIVWFSASIVLGRLYPEAIQRFSVDPNTYAQEQPYIANNISMTRLAFGLDQWQSRSYGGAAPLTEAAIQSEEDTFTNARLWDYRPLQTTLDQLQAVRQYYDFHDVDTDRYLIDGTLRQVMLSGRELAIDKDPDAPNWVNQRVIKTHGIGVAMVPVNEVTPEGQPRLWIRDLPPTSNSGAPEITQPRIYFGESDSHYVVVRANQQEFDYPANSNTGQGDPTTSWTGQTGIPIDSTLSRLLFSIRFRDFDLLISNQVQAGSQLLFHRTISERLGMVAPFLRFDKDPYLVVVDGKLVYVQDAYTLSDKFPNANSFDTSQLSVGGTASGLGSEDINYIRNSVKITIDAYDGTMHFYVADPTEPLIRAWQGIFPQLFEPLSKMPAELQAHLRVPEELFNVQTRMYGQYHVTQPVTFFNNTDRWTVPTEQTNQQSLLPEAYYVVMRMPGEPKAEFLLLQPMIARSRPNMIAWVAARNDAPNYGEVRAYQFPADTTIFGPSQIEARIDQDPTISAQISLWNQSGSEVIRGNLIVVPVGDSLIYLQPVYLQSTSSAFPEFQRIVVASPTTVVWGRTLAEALNLLLAAQGGGPGTSPSPGPTPTPGPSTTPGPSATPQPTLPPGGGLPTDVTGLVNYANAHFELAQTALKNGDFATYGTEMDNVQRALEALGQLTGSPAPSLAP